MSSKHLRGDVNYCWPTAEVAVMGAKVGMIEQSIDDFITVFTVQLIIELICEGCRFHSLSRSF